LQYCTNLTNLYLYYNQISNISPLTGLSNLTELFLDGNQISDISPLVSNSGINIGDWIVILDNPLSITSCTVYIPQLQSRGVNVQHNCP